jgi:hypothetical protein
MISIAHDTLTDATDNLDRISIGSYGITTVLSSSGWQKYYAATNNTVWNPIPLNNDLFGWYAIPGTFNAWPSTSQAVVIYALDWTQYVGIAVLSNLGVPNSFPVNIPNTVTKITLGGIGTYAGILNNGSLSTTDGEDKLAGISYGVGSVNYLGGSGGSGILNKQSAIINTRGGNDRIAGLATGFGSSGILNYGQIFTENGDDKVLSQASGNGTMFGLENRNGLIDTGSGFDLIQGTGTNAIGGIANIQGSILSGDGDDVILGQVTNDSGSFSVGIANSNGVIDAGSGNDTISGTVNATISGTATGLNIYYGISNNGVINAGSGNDTISGTANVTISGTATGYSVGIFNGKNGSIDGGIGSITDIDTITGTATGGFSTGIRNQGGTINVNGGLTPVSVMLTGTAMGFSSAGIYNDGRLFGTPVTSIATRNDADKIMGSAEGERSIGIANIIATITNTGDKMGQIIGKASGTDSIGILNIGLIDMSHTISSDGVVIQGMSNGVESRGISNEEKISTGSGNDVITGQTTGGRFGILNFGLIDTGAGDDTVTSIGDFGNFGYYDSDGLFLGEGNDTLSGFGDGNSSFDGGADIDELILPILSQGQYYTSNVHNLGFVKALKS